MIHCVMDFVDFFGKIVKISQSEETIKQQHEYLLVLLGSINNMEIKELMVFFADDIMCQKHKSEWLFFMLETHFFNTCVGGQKFYNRLEFCLNKNNHYMVQMFLFAISFGFLGQFDCFPDIYYKKCIVFLRFNEKKPSEKTTYIINRQGGNRSLFSLVFPLVAVVIITQMLEIVMLKGLVL